MTKKEAIKKANEYHQILQKNIPYMNIEKIDVIVRNRVNLTDESHSSVVQYEFKSISKRGDSIKYRIDTINNEFPYLRTEYVTSKRYKLLHITDYFLANNQFLNSNVTNVELEDQIAHIAPVLIKLNK
jgi:hypothetical protein